MNGHIITPQPVEYLVILVVNVVLNTGLMKTVLFISGQKKTTEKEKMRKLEGIQTKKK